MIDINDLHGLLPESNIGLVINRNFDLGIPLHNQKIVHEKLNHEGYRIVEINDLNNLINRVNELTRLANSYKSKCGNVVSDNSTKSKSLAEEIGLIYDDD